MKTAKAESGKWKAETPVKAAAAAQCQIQRRLSALRQAASILQQAGFAVQTVGFVGRYILKSTHCAPDLVVLLRPVQPRNIFSHPLAEKDSSPKAKRKSNHGQDARATAKT